MASDEALRKAWYAAEKKAHEMFEAAEFEARVAARLLEYHATIMQQGGICEACPAWEECTDTEIQCKDMLLKYARLQIEEEMDANRE